MHAPIVEAMKAVRGLAFSNASRDEASRKTALAETEAAWRWPNRFPPLSRRPPRHAGDGTSIARDNQQEGARRSVEDIVEIAARANVQVTLEVIPNPLSSAEALVQLVEEELDGIDVGVCLDYGHAHLMGDLGEAIETLSGHLWTTHVHDNDGTRDEHLTPYAGTIDWDAAMMETQKIGYDGTLMFEVADTGDPIDVLRRSARRASALEKTFVTFDEV